MNRKLTVISCPSCGREYLPAEIFVPKVFFGVPDIIRRDSEGKIIDFLGSDMDLNETYCCDSCSKPFKVLANITFDVKEDSDNDFTTPYTTKISSRFQLAES